MEERRRMVRRMADRELGEYIVRKTGSAPAQVVFRRKFRRAIRHECEVVIRLDTLPSSDGYEFTHEKGKRFRGRLLDLSEGGASVFTKVELAPETAFQLDVKMRNGSTIRTLAIVRRSKYKEANNGHVIGAEFTAVDEQNAKAIKRFLEELEATVGM